MLGLLTVGVDGYYYNGFIKVDVFLWGWFKLMIWYCVIDGALLEELLLVVLLQVLTLFTPCKNVNIFTPPPLSVGIGVKGNYCDYKYWNYEGD